jgi:hypothetical protein
MPSPSVLDKRKKQKIATKQAQLTGLGILSPEKDNEGNKIQIQPTIIQRPNALQMKAFRQGNLGMQMPRAGLADMAIHANQAESNITGSGVSNANLMNEARRKNKQGLY